MTESKLSRTLKEEGFQKLFDSGFDSSMAECPSTYLTLNSLIGKAVENGYKKIVVDMVELETSENYLFDIYGKK